MLGVPPPSPFISRNFHGFQASICVYTHTHTRSLLKFKNVRGTIQRIQALKNTFTHTESLFCLNCILGQ